MQRTITRVNRLDEAELFMLKRRLPATTIIILALASLIILAFRHPPEEAPDAHPVVDEPEEELEQKEQKEGSLEEQEEPLEGGDDG